MKNYQNTAARRMPGDNRRQIRSMVQTAIFGAIIVIMAFNPFSRIYPAGIYKSHYYPHPRYTGVPAPGAQKGSGPGISFWSYQFH